MSVEEFAEYLVTNLSKNPDLVKVKRFQTDEDTIIDILVSEADMPFVIGKGGAIASSIKDLVRAKAYKDGLKNVKVNIDCF